MNLGDHSIVVKSVPSASDSPAPPVASVLLVEDSKVQREQLARMCRAMGVAEVHEAMHGADALDLLARLPGPPQAMVIDLEMPVMDGVQLIEQLRQRGLAVPFVLCSAREAALLESVKTMASVQGLPVARALRKPINDQQLYSALQDCAKAGHNRKPATQAQAPRVQACVSGVVLAQAIAQRTIQPYYQPKVDVLSGMIRGVEVLARWLDPALGNPTPDHFIALAEREGQIHALTLSILDQSLEQAARWGARGLVLPMAVNLSPRLLESPGLVDEIGALVARHAVRADQLVLEITESSVVGSEGMALGVLARLRMRGFGLSIDDYGTGFSSMQQLSRVPFTELKIDRSFVDGAHHQDHLRAILQSSIEMCTRMGITSVAEGVETLNDLRLLQRYGCCTAQGWLFGKAMPGSELPNWLKQHRQRLAQLRAPSPEHNNKDGLA